MRSKKLQKGFALVANLAVIFGGFAFLAAGKVGAAVTYNYNTVLAQSASTQTSFNRVTNSRGMHLGGVFVHDYGTDKAMYVYDSGNNRILAYLNPDGTNSDTPEKVFGQNGSYTTGACNGDNTSDSASPSADTLCLNRGAFAISQEEEPRFASVDTDSNGNLYVLDQYNNRVLKFNNPFGTGTGEGDTTADYVWGQADFVSKVCNRGAGYPSYPSTSLTDNGICTSKNITASTDQFLGGSVDIDALGNLWVTDTVNNRVIRFPFDSMNNRPADNADIVIGQPNMQSFTNGYNSCGTFPTNTGLCLAYVVRTDPTNNEVYIVHGNLGGSPNYRITVFTPNSGATVYTYNRQFGSGTLNIPRSLDFLNSAEIVVGDIRSGQSDRILVFNKNGTLSRTVLNANISGSTADSAVDLQEINGQLSVVGSTLYVSEQRTHNSILKFDATNLSSAGTLTYSGEMLGGVNYTWNNISSQSLSSPFGLAFSKNQNQLFSSDKYRVLVWNVGTNPSTDAAANYVIGQSNFTNNTTATSNYFKDKVAGLAVDEVNNRLWVARNQEIYAFSLPITSNNPAPIKNFITRIPNSIYLGNIKVSGQTDNLVFNAWSVAFDNSDGSLWIVDSLNSRVVRVNDPYGANPEVNLVIGQNNINGLECNRNNADKTHPTAQTLCNPSSVAFDNQNNLYIAEGVYEGRTDRPGNKRIVEYDRATIATAISSGIFSEPAADRVYAAPNFTTNPIYTKAGCLTDTPCNPISISFDSQNRMSVLSDAYFNDQGKRIYIYSDPLKNTGYVAFDTMTDVMLTNPMGQGGFSAFNNAGDLYVQDHTWNRVTLLTKSNYSPSAISYATPANGAVNQPLATTLSWNASTDPESDPVVYDVYFGTSVAGMSLVSANQSGLTYAPTLAHTTTYYWKVVAKDDEGNVTYGAVRNFSTYQVVATPTNLATGKTIASSAGVTVGVASNIIDGTKFSDGTPNDTAPSIKLNATSSYVSIDLGSAQSITSVTFQADSNDSYRIQTSANNSSWTNYGSASTAGAATGFITKTNTVSRSNVRYVRIKPVSGDGNYRVSEIEVY